MHQVILGSNQIQNGEPEEEYAQEVPGVVCFQPEDVQQEVRIQFDSKAGKIQSFKLSKKKQIEINQNKKNKMMSSVAIIGKHKKLPWHLKPRVCHERIT